MAALFTRLSVLILFLLRNQAAELKIKDEESHGQDEEERASGIGLQILIEWHDIRNFVIIFGDGPGEGIVL